MCACRYIRSRYGSTPPPPSATYGGEPGVVYAQETLDEYYTPGQVSRSSSSYDLSGGVREQLGTSTTSVRVFVRDCISQRRGEMKSY